MRLVQRLCFIVLISSLMAAQTSAPSGSDTSQMESDVKKLLEAMAAQQKAMADQQKQISEQQQEIERLKQQLKAQPQAVSANGDVQPAKVVNASLNAPNTNPAARPASDVAQEEKPKESPLSFRIGGAEFTPGGFMDFTTIFRTTNTGNLGTNFFSIPFSNIAQGKLTETRFTAQNSRVSLKATDKFGKNDVTGYLEMDFLGNDASNVFVTSNSHTLRQRLYWLDLRRDKWEIFGGQTWSWLTPNRVGLSPVPADIFFGQNMDFNYQAGLTWTRAPEFRVAYHPNDNWAVGIALENPEQFAGQTTASGLTQVVFPDAFKATLGQQFDLANNTNTPNLHPDVIPKIAYDTNLGGKHFHAEAAGLLTTIKITNINLTSGVFVKHSKTGGGVEAATNLEVVKNFRIVASGFYSDGGGRYIFGMGPDAVVRPNATGTDLAVSLVHSGSGIFGFEGQFTPKTMIYAYYGGAYFQRNAFADPTSTTVLLTPISCGPGQPLTAKPCIGFGGTSEAGSSVQNRAIQEGTLGWIQTFWKNPQYGALQLITQYSYLTRAPWFVALGAPKNAHLSMGWVDLRYVLP